MQVFPHVVKVNANSHLPVVGPGMGNSEVHVPVVVHKVLAGLCGPRLGVLALISITLAKEALGTCG